MTAGSDNLVKMFHHESRDHPLIVVEVLDETLVDCCFVADTFNYIAVCTAEGSVSIYNLSESIDRPVETVVVSKSGLDPVHSIKSSSTSRLLVVVSKSGCVSAISIGETIKDDRFLLDKVYTL